MSIPQNIWRFQSEIVNKRKAQTNQGMKREQYPHGAAILTNKKNTSMIGGIGYNHYPSNSHGFKGTIHAEIDAFQRNYTKIGRKKVSILVVRTNGGNSRPCSNCIRNMVDNSQMRVKRVYYTIDNGNIVSENLKQLSANCDQHLSMYYRSLRDGTLNGSGNLDEMSEDDPESAKPYIFHTPIT